ncbi:MAG: hypothetical protein CVU74_00175 [Deltaproteobacteria bacterium HGW-Deltaproteobacteria-9]|nr:MAG: hypothetical protein CVU74_00175 [Deltaproteobacteria bacterium HGW-Deltaproteobacteria-9]
MTQAGISFQSDFNQRDHLRDSLCRSFLKICIKVSAVVILIQMPLADACSEWKIMPWRPFQVKKELVMQPRKGKVIKRGKAVTGKSSNVQDVGAQRLQGAQQIWPDAQSFYVSELSAQVWGGYLRRAGVFPALPKSGMQAETLFISDLFRDTMARDNLLMSPSGRAPATTRGKGGAHYIRFYFFNHDMKDLNRDAPERRASGDSLWETFLSPLSGERNQSVLETMGKIFEPKVDLGIEF